MFVMSPVKNPTQRENWVYFIFRKILLWGYAYEMLDRALGWELSSVTLKKLLHLSGLGVLIHKRWSIN